MATKSTAADAGGFTGFRPEALQFLADLAMNNDRAWFTPHKAEFERLLKEPMEALCVALADAFREHGVPLTADPRKSPFRIYRDTRFSKDKSPYKLAHSAGFAWAGGQGAEGGGGYFHLEPGEIHLGGGMWHPEPSRLAVWRRMVDQEPERVLAAVEDPAFVKEFGTLRGDHLVRVPQGFAKDHPHAQLLKLKDVTFGRRLADEDVFSPKLPETMAKSFARAKPVFELLASVEA